MYESGGDEVALFFGPEAWVINTLLFHFDGIRSHETG